MNKRIVLRAVRATIPPQKIEAWLYRQEHPTDEECRIAGWTKGQIARYADIKESDIDADLRWLEVADHHLISIVDPDYPLLLKQIPDPPLALFVIGDKDLLSKPQIAMVGSRSPSAAGREIAASFAETLAIAGLVITSGLALGIDAASHSGALKAPGKTIAVCGTGVDRIYPTSHRQLAQAIRQQGALVSALPLGAPPTAHHFPERNRIISGLSLGVIVVEAALQSGSLITARLAADQGREVFAIPGSIHNPLSRGCHYLIKNGAKLVENADDILEELGPLASLLPTSKRLIHDEIKAENQGDTLTETVRLAIDFTSTPVDLIIARTQLSSEIVSAQLLLLELAGQIKHDALGYYRQN